MYCGAMVIFFATFLCAAELGKLLSFPNHVATFWPPAGIYLAALVMTPRRYWPSLAAAAWCALFVFNVILRNHSVLICTGFWLGNTLEAVLGATYLRYGAGGSSRFTLTRLPNVLFFAGAAAILPTAIGGLVGGSIVTLAFGTPFLKAWQIWWVANGLGNLIIAPLFLVLNDSRLRLPVKGIQIIEGAAAAMALTAITNWSLQISGLTFYAIFPIMLWIAMRFDLRGTVLANCLLALVTIWHYAQEDVLPLTNGTLEEQVLIIQTFLGITAITSLTVASAQMERKLAMQEIRTSEGRYRHLFENLSDLIVIFDAAGNIQFLNNAWKELLGYPIERFDRAFLMQLIHPEDRSRCQLQFEQAIQGNLRDQIEFRIATAQGQMLSLAGVCEFRRENVRSTEIYSVFRDMTRQKAHEEESANYQRQLEQVNARLRSLSQTDALTRLHNRRFFQQKLDEELDRARRYQSTLSLLLIDVDHFKQFNDTYGHLAGDSVLAKVATILGDSARSNDVVARYGGEEFAILLPMTELEGACQLAERLRRRVEAGPWQGRQITVSIGVSATLETGSNDPEKLIHLADQALYTSKQSGRNQVTAMNAQHLAKLSGEWLSGVDNL